MIEGEKGRERRSDKPHRIVIIRANLIMVSYPLLQRIERDERLRRGDLVVVSYSDVLVECWFLHCCFQLLSLNRTLTLRTLIKTLRCEFEALGGEIVEVSSVLYLVGSAQTSVTSHVPAFMYAQC